MTDKPCSCTNKFYCPEHLAENVSPPDKQSWEDYFTKEYHKWFEDRQSEAAFFNIKSFISQVESKAREEAVDGAFKYQKDIQSAFATELLEKTEGMKKHTDPVPFPITQAYNQALSEVSEIIKNMMK